jgi:hypothetical protein
MNIDQQLFWATAAIVANIYVLAFLSRRWRKLKFQAYVWNLGGLSLCGFTLALTSPDPRWLSFFILNLVFQNALLAGDRRRSR